MRYLVILTSLLFGLSTSKPVPGCRDENPMCRYWATRHYCHMNNYVEYMTLMCPESCGFCYDIPSGLSGSDQEEMESGSSTGSEADVHRVIPEIDEDFRHMEELGSSRSHSNSEENDRNENRFQSLSGSGDETSGHLSSKTSSEETKSLSDEEATPKHESDDQQPSVSGSGFDSASANLWPDVRVEPGGSDGESSDRELQLNRRSEVSRPNDPTMLASRGAEGSALAEIGRVNSGERVLSEGSEFPVSSGSGSNTASGEDDEPFDNSAFDSESDSGCSSGYGCYESDSAQGGNDANIKQRSSITTSKTKAVPSGSGSSQLKSFRFDPNAHATVGPYVDEASSSGPALLGSGAEKQSGIGTVETGVAFRTNVDYASGSGISSPSSSESQDQEQYEESASGSGRPAKIESGQLPSTSEHRKKISLMESMMKSGDLRAIKISHGKENGASRDKVPRLHVDKVVLSDLGKGRKVSLILNQDFHEGYSDDDKAAYNVLARNVKKEIEKALGSKTVVSDVSFTEARDPGESPRFSRVMASFRLLGDVSELEHAVRGGAVRNLVVDKNFFKTW